MRDDLRHLAALQGADEVPGEERPGRRSPSPRDPARGSHRAASAPPRAARRALQRHVLDRREDLDRAFRAADARQLGCDPLRFARTSPRRRSLISATIAHDGPATTAIPAWRPVTPCSRRCEKNSAARSRSCRDRDRAPSATPAPAGGGARRSFRSAFGAAARCRPGARQRRMDLLADLVAAAPGAGSDRGGQRAAAHQLAQRPYPLADHAAGQSPPARVEHRDGAVAGERDRQAVGT